MRRHPTPTERIAVILLVLVTLAVLGNLGYLIVRAIQEATS